MPPVEFRVVEITLKNGTILEIVHNLPADGPYTITQAINAWSEQATSETAEDLCAFINSQRYVKLANRIAMTRQEFEKWNEGKHISIGLN